MATVTTKRRTAKHDAFADFFVRCRPRIPLSHREFAERFIRLATGPYAGQPFRVDRQPFTGLLFDELDSGRWPEIHITGPSQSSKTLSGFVIPTLRDVVELKEDVLIGVPEADMAADKWDKDFLPTLRESPDLMWLIPDKGPGSRGGRIKDRVTLGNGVDIKIMSRGGQDTAKAGYTARRIRVTESAGFSQAAEASVEADPLRQLKARQRSFRRAERSLIVEGTITIEEELPYRARGHDDDDKLISTRSRIVSPCPFCGEHICPGREHLVGWQDAETEQEATDRACFICPSCSKLINDEMRRASMAECRLVHWGQSVDQNGRVVGDLPPVSTLWFQWHAWHNLLLDAADTAIDEWKASQLEEGTAERENAEKELCQFAHSVPFKSKLAENEPLSAQVVRKRTDEWQKNLLPADTVKLEIGVDVGDWTAWWVAVAFRENGQLHVPAYGAFDVKRQDNDELATRIIRSLTEFNESTVLAGFPVEGSDGLRLPDGVGVDIGHMPDEVCAAVRTFGRGWGNRWKPMRGRGGSRRQVGKNNGGYNHPLQVTQARPLVGNQWFAELNLHRRLFEVTFNADYWLLHMQDRLRATPGGKGALTLYKKDIPNEHDRISNHWTAEQLKRSWDPTKGGLVEKWVKNGQNHLGDALKMALVMGDIHGYKLREIAEPKPEQVPESGTSIPRSDFYARLMQ
jgi:hypothetical protein